MSSSRYYKSNNYEEYRNSYPMYDRHPEDYLNETVKDFFMNRKILVEKEKTILDVGEDYTKLKELEEDLYYNITDIFDMDSILDDEFIVEDNEQFYINLTYEDGEISDAISDDTGYLVDTLSYHLI